MASSATVLTIAFPAGGYALLKLVTLPFIDDLSATIHAARTLMLLFFAAAATSAYLALVRLVHAPSARWIALTATLLAFSSPYCLYYNDMIHPKTAMDLFGVMLTFHGIVVFVQEGRFWQMTVKTVLSLLLGWHVFALLLTFILLGAISELVRARPVGPGHVGRACSTASAVTPFLGRCVALGAVALLVGLSILTFNFVNEWLALNGKVELTELPSFNSMLRRFGVDRTYYTSFPDILVWPSFLETQFARIGGGISLPFSVASRVRDLAAPYPTAASWGSDSAAVIGCLMSVGCLVSLVGLAFVRRFRQRRFLLPLATLALFGFVWSLPMRFNVAFHDYESLFHIGIPLVLFSLVLSATRRLAGRRSLVGLTFAALAVFVSSAYEMGRIGREAVAPGFQKAVLADFRGNQGNHGRTGASLPPRGSSWYP